MQHRDEIVRGLRLGSILLAVLLAAFTGYRMFHDAPPAHQAPVTVETPPVTPPVPVHVNAAPVTPAGTSGTVPPPPPIGAGKPAHKVIRKQAAPMVEAHAATHVETGVSAEPVVDATPQENPAAVASASLTEKAADKEVPQPAVAQGNPAPAHSTDDADASKSPNRGKRMLQTVGHWLHIGKKDVPAESVRQP